MKPNKPMTKKEWNSLPAIVQYFLRDEKPKGCKVKELTPKKHAPNGATSADPSPLARKG